MIAFAFLQTKWLFALAGVPVFVLLGVAALLLHRAALRRFFGEAAGRPWTRAGSILLRSLKIALGAAAAGALIVALARPAINPQPQKVTRTGRDVIFAIDVSRSMLAKDVRPSRLERAKLGIRDVLDVAEGDRIGLVVFAGAAVLRCPLTSDYSFLRLTLDDTNPDSVGRGGTAIGEAIRFAASQLVPDDDTGAAAARDGRSRTIVLITDGEDHESRPVEAAQAAAKKGVRIVTIGIGSELSGAPVPVGDGSQYNRPANPSQKFVEYEGQEVFSKMDPGVLRQVAQATPGEVFINAGTSNVELDTLYKKLMRSATATVQETTELVRYTELFQIFLGLALVCMLMEAIIDAWYH